jgi:hypothetical protein
MWLAILRPRVHKDFGIRIKFKFKNSNVPIHVKQKGIHIKQTEHLQSQFADDTTVMLDGTVQSLNAILDALSLFAQILGLRVNFEKT